jgi:phosphatidate cytidylyltransferase
MQQGSAASAASRRISGLRRFAIGAGLGVAVSATILWLGRPFTAALVGGWTVLATFEFAQMLGRADIKLNRWMLAALNVAIAGAAYIGWLPQFFVAPLAVVLLASVLEREVRPRVPVYSVFVLVYLGFFPAHLILIKNMVAARALSPWLVLFPLLLTWANDSGGLGFGRWLGRHKLAPVVSPNKTVEGYIGGLACSAVFSAVYLRFCAPSPFSALPIWWLAMVGVGLGTIAQAGDLFESMFKRAAGVKDSSTALADHGGFLDRVDSLLFTVPAFYYLLLYIR